MRRCVASADGPGALARSGQRGWTLIELVIAVGVVGLLIGIAQPLYTTYVDRARVGRAVSEIRLIEAAVDQYMIEFRRVPERIDTLVDPLPVDPWGNPYQYLKLRDGPPGAAGMARKDRSLVPLNTDYDLYSMGKDGQTQAPLTSSVSDDDVIRANDGGYVGLAEQY
jgi:general secretion pathway protein G